MKNSRRTLLKATGSLAALALLPRSALAAYPELRLGATPPHYEEARPFHEALVAANPRNLVWGTDWPHPRPEGAVPDAANLLAVFLDWTAEPPHRQAILVDNPCRLYE